MAGLFGELKRRSVFKVGAAYVVVAWLIAQGVDVFLENFGAPAWAIKTILLLLIAGLPVALIFAWAFEITPEGIKKEKDVDRSQSVTHETGRKLDFIIIAVLLVALGWFAWDKFTPADHAKPNAQAENLATAERPKEKLATAATVQQVSDKSIAVLPFVNMSSDPEQEYFSDGISEEILNALAKVKDLKVAGRTSSFAFKGENQDLRQIGATLGVEHILEGSVRKSGTKVRITAQLIQVEDGFHLWSDSYDRELTDVFAIQDEIARAILEQLKAHLLAGEQQALVATRADSEAYDLYLLARQRMYERSKSTLESAAALLDQAIAIDPDYAPAYAQRGVTALLLSDQDYGTIPAAEAVTEAKPYIDRALELAPEDPEALAALGLYYNNQPGKKAEAIAALQKSLQINPNLINASNWLQQAYSEVGNIPESMAILEQLVERDPLYRPGLSNITQYYVNTGRVDKAVALIEQIRPSMPNDPFLFRMESEVLYARADYADGLRLAEQGLALQPDNYALQGQVAQGLLFTGQYERLAVVGYPAQKVIALQALGRIEEATVIARAEAAKGEDVGILIALLASSGQQQAAVDFIEEHWASLDEFEAAFPLLGNGPDTMLNIAYAYLSVGNEERFQDAIQRYRSAMDTAMSLGFNNYWVDLLESIYAAMTGDEAAAISHLGKSIDSGMLVAARLSNAWPVLKPLEGHPEFEAIQVRMMEHLNKERASLGLEPMKI